jgi:small-conductance mechanosensitive channel
MTETAGFVIVWLGINSTVDKGGVMDFLDFSFEDLLNQIVEFLPRLGLGILVFIISIWISNWIARWARRSMEKRGTDLEVIVLFRLLIRWGIRVLGLVIALEMIAPGRFGSLVAGLGVAGFTIGFALQDVAKNFVAGIILLWQQPFDIGDGIQVGDYAGTVLGITLRTTEIRTWDGRYVLIPNGDVLTSPIENFSKPPRRRIGISAGISSDSDLDQVTRIALDAIKDVPGLLEDPTPRVIFQNFGDFAIEFTCYYWINTKEFDYLNAQNAGFVGIRNAFERERIEMPYPIQTVLLRQ